MALYISMKMKRHHNAKLLAAETMKHSFLSDNCFVTQTNQHQAKMFAHKASETIPFFNIHSVESEKFLEDKSALTLKIPGIYEGEIYISLIKHHYHNSKASWSI